MGLFDRFKKNTKEGLLEHLQNRISDKSSLENIVDVFEEMCNIPIKEDMILFETGTYSFTGEPMFNFSLVRQFPNDEEEYYQIHLNVEPCEQEAETEAEGGTCHAEEGDDLGPELIEVFLHRASPSIL